MLTQRHASEANVTLATLKAGDTSNSLMMRLAAGPMVAAK
jgi:hypothetical protein